MHGWPLTTWDTKQALRHQLQARSGLLRPEHVRRPPRYCEAATSVLRTAAVRGPWREGSRRSSRDADWYGWAARRRSSAAALATCCCACREPQGIRRCYRIPDPSSRGECFLRTSCPVSSTTAADRYAKAKEDRFMRALNAPSPTRFGQTQNRLTENGTASSCRLVASNTPTPGHLLAGNREVGPCNLRRSKTTKLGDDTLKAGWKADQRG